MKISVLIPVYNGAPYLEQAIESILQQDTGDFELLLIDDCSSDGGAAIMAEQAVRDPRIRPIYHRKNVGLAATLNEGLRLARGEYVARLDQDDEALPHRLRIQAEYLDAHPQTLVVGGVYLNMGAQPRLDRPCPLPTAPQEIAAILPRENCMCHPAVMMRRQAVLDAGGYREEFRNAEDYDLWLRLSRVGELANLPAPVLRYRLTTSGMSYSRRWEQLRFVFLAQESHRSPDEPVDTLWPKVEERLAAFDRPFFFDCVARHAVTELHALGFPSDARRMLQGFASELSPSCRTHLEEMLGPTQASPSPGAAGATFRRGRWYWLPFARRVGLMQSIAAVVVLLLPSFIWIARDQSVWPWDQAWYGEVAVDLWWTLTHQTPEWTQEMLVAFGIKAPGISWLAQFFVPLAAWIGSIDIALLLSILVTQAATLVLLFQIGTRLWLGDHRGGWLACAWMAAAPLFVALSHQFLVEPLQLFAVTYFFWVMFAAETQGRVWIVAHTMAATAIAMLAKATSPLYVLFPALLIIYRFFRSRYWISDLRQPKGWCEVVGFIASAGLMIVAVRWYWQNQQTLREFVQLASSSEVALDYGHRPEFWSKWRFWLLATLRSFFTPFSLIGLGAIAIVLSLRRSEKARTVRPLTGAMIAGVAQVVLVLAVFTRQINEENRYLLPLLPAILCMVIPWLGRVRPGISFTAAVGLALVQWGWVHAIGAGIRPWSPHASYWLKPPVTDPAMKSEVERVVQTTTFVESAFRYHVIGYEAPWFNANSLAFYAAKNRLTTGIRSYYTSLGYAANDLDAAWERMVSLRPVTFISLAADRQPQPPNFVNQISQPFLERITLSPIFKPFPFESSLGIMVFKYVEASTATVESSP